MKPKLGQHISDTQPAHVRDELPRNLRGQQDHSLLGWLRKNSRLGKQYELLGRMILIDDTAMLPVKPGATPGDPKQLRGFRSWGSGGTWAIAGSQPGDSLNGKHGEEVLREIRWRARGRPVCE